MSAPTSNASIAARMPAKPGADDDHVVLRVHEYGSYRTRDLRGG